MSLSSNLPELEVVRSDLGFYIDFLSSLTKRPSSSQFIFNLVPYLSLFTVEAYSVIKKEFPHYADSLDKEHMDIIRQSRMRVKLLDDTNAQVSGSFELYDWIKEYQEKLYIKSYTGLLAPIKKALQCDLGITLYDSHIIGTTHNSLLLSGLERSTLMKIAVDSSQNIGPYMQKAAIDIASFIRELSTLAEISPVHLNTFQYELEDNKGYTIDVKSEQLLRRIFNGKSSIPLNFSLLFFLSQVNFIVFVLPKLVSESCITIFKLKFVLLYHVSSSLQKLQNYSYPLGILTNESKDFFRQIFQNKILKKITSKKKLRDVLVHYSLVKDTQAYDIDFEAYVESYFPNQSFYEIGILVDDNLLHISRTLEEWLNWDISKYQMKQWES